ncbi:MAG: hypothetical protein ACD_3C00065G0001 [uncultured bacterium (gcode 4)]|uniref:Fibrinogen C-terminal domain-containing protein n=1 Tax=uncultured bacterium (gcode 4) TaxID=1234023 RepID=K2FB99_9BACT|nr:MAG: hypothetical protein ACD_3C00065G0001 [uncultured bacterium (gcode 4)]
MTSCIPASTWNFVAGAWQTSQTQCSPWSYQWSTWQSSCTTVTTWQFQDGVWQSTFKSCSAIPANSIYNPSSWLTSNSCTWSCSGGYYQNWSTCVLPNWSWDATAWFAYFQWSTQVYPKSCNDLLISTTSNFKIWTSPYNWTKFVDWIYYIKPNASDAFKAYCDMSKDGGGWTKVFYSDSDSVPRSSISGSDWNTWPSINFSRLWSMKDIKNIWWLYEFYIRDSSTIWRNIIFTQTNKYYENPVGNDFIQKSWNFYYSTQTDWTSWKWLWLWNFWNWNFNSFCSLAMSFEWRWWTYCLQDQFIWYNTWPWFYDLTAYPTTGYDVWAQSWVEVYQR